MSAIVVAGVGPAGWFRLLVWFVMVCMFVGPAIALGLAWDYRGKRPGTSRRCAAIGMLGAILSVGVCFGGPSLMTDDPMGAAIGSMVIGGINAVLQAAVFSLCWVASRPPRSERREE